MKLKAELVEEIKQTLRDPAKSNRFPHYQKMDANNLDWYVDILYQLLTSSVRNNDRMLLLDYVGDISLIRFKEGFPPKEICSLLYEVGDIVSSKLHAEPGLKGLKQEIHDFIVLTMQMTVDEVEDAFEKFEKQVSIARKEEIEAGEIEDKINQMETFYRPPEESP